MPQNKNSQEPRDRQGSESDAAGWIMLGDLIANLDRPDVTAAVLMKLDPIVATRIEQRAAAAAMSGRSRLAIRSPSMIHPAASDSEP